MTLPVCPSRWRAPGVVYPDQWAAVPGVKYPDHASSQKFAPKNDGLKVEWGRAEHGAVAAMLPAEKRAHRARYQKAFRAARKARAQAEAARV